MISRARARQGPTLVTAFGWSKMPRERSLHKRFAPLSRLRERGRGRGLDRPLVVVECAPLPNPLPNPPPQVGEGTVRVARKSFSRCLAAAFAAKNNAAIRTDIAALFLSERHLHPEAALNAVSPTRSRSSAADNFHHGYTTGKGNVLFVAQCPHQQPLQCRQGLVTRFVEQVADIVAVARRQAAMQPAGG